VQRLDSPDNPVASIYPSPKKKLAAFMKEDNLNYDFSVRQTATEMRELDVISACRIDAEYENASWTIFEPVTGDVIVTGMLPFDGIVTAPQVRDRSKVLDKILNAVHHRSQPMHEALTLQGVCWCTRVRVGIHRLGREAD
jgi:hypothetical protein